jgi:ribosome-binding protein aMBF1 (putative translation factor)
VPIPTLPDNGWRYQLLVLSSDGVLPRFAAVDAPADFPARIGRRIRALRTAAGLSQTQLADRAGIPARYLSRWENGHNRPTDANLQMLADTLDIEIERFFYD